MQVANEGDDPKDIHCEEVTICLLCTAPLSGPPEYMARDDFFRQVPGVFPFTRCDCCASLLLSRRLTAESLPLAYAAYYTHTPGDAAMAPTRGMAAHVRQRLRTAYERTRFGPAPGVFDRVLAPFFRMGRAGRRDFDTLWRLIPPAPARVLDYGCGGGDFLRRITAAGYVGHGVDFDPAAINLARQRGLTVWLPEEFDMLADRPQYDAITLSHVIEHVPDPRFLLTRLSRLLAPGGTLYIEVPQAGATGLAIFGEHWRGLEVPRHLCIPSHEGLDAALTAAGLRRTERTLRGSVRAWVWAESRQMVPAALRQQVWQAEATAEPETWENAEFAIVVARHCWLRR